MEILDIILCVPLVYGFYRGFKKGLIFEVISLVSLVVAVFFSVRFSVLLEIYLVDQQLISEKYVGVVSFILVFIAVVLSINLIGKILEKILKTIHLEFINKLLGAVFGMVKFFVILSSLIFFVNRMDVWMSIIPQQTKENSILYESSLTLSRFLLPKLLDYFPNNPI